ncbi:hypothetical protein ATN88_15985 [Enterovibrio coralii]|uniref:Uncharacterized protein n=1 Tax=Enterovibrio coralii TaxID=294935 RepID=A0A135I5U7_9GAMM|nr:hypothetical protein ATN88_15985 [Enterovibrio coralii]
MFTKHMRKRTATSEIYALRRKFTAKTANNDIESDYKHDFYQGVSDNAITFLTKVFVFITARG